MTRAPIRTTQDPGEAVVYENPGRNAAATYVDWYKGKRRQTWTTPRDFFEALHSEYIFTMDGAASPTNALLPRYHSVESRLPWDGERVFCNPPWSSIPPFIELAATAALAVLLVPARVNARWFHRALLLGAEPRYFLGKLRFGEAAWNSPVDCLLLVFNTPSTPQWGAGR
jgi:hypothetical protein